MDEEVREFQITDAAMWNEWEPKDRSVQKICTIAEQDDKTIRINNFCKIMSLQPL